MIRYTDRNVTRAPREFGHGRFNTVYEVEHDDGERRIFKPLSPPDLTRKKRVERGWVASRTGIDPYNPQTAARNLSTCRLAEELGFDVVVRTELGLHTLPNATQPQLGLVMEVALGVRGQSQFRSASTCSHSPIHAAEITKLQLLDCLTAQGDRHGGNYFIGSISRVLASGWRVSTTTSVWAQRFTILTSFDGACDNQPDQGFRGCGLPPVIDTDMARAFEELTPDRVDYLIGDKVGRKEVHAAVQRLSAIKDHIAHLRQEDRIIEPDGWEDARVEALTDFTNSYFKRERRIQLANAGLGNAAAAAAAALNAM